VSKGLLDPLTTAPSLLLILLLVGLGLAALRRAPMVALPILWFFGLLVIESTVIPLDLAYEHRLYLPSMLPIVAAVAALVAGVRVGVRRPAVRLAIAACAIVLLAAWTWQRNEIWRDPVRLWTDTAAKSPNKARVHTNLAKAQLDAGHATAALQSYQRAYQLDPRQVEPLSAQALIYFTHYNDPAKARALLDEATRLSPRYVPALVNLGVVQMRSGESRAAADSFTRVLSYDAHQRDALYNLAALAFNARDYAEAERWLERGIASWPAHARMHALLGLVYLKRGEPARSQHTLATAFSLAPGDPMVDAAQRELMKRLQ
jgi:Flp pilus assembly protein TadD